MEIEELYANFNKSYNNLKTKALFLNKNIEDSESRVKDYEETIETTDNRISQLMEVSSVFKSMGDEQTQTAKDILADVVNDALETIPLKQNYELKIEESRGDKVRELIFKLRDKDLDKLRPTRVQIGTGVNQIVSTLALIVVLKFSKKSKIILYDEQLSGLQDVETIKTFMSALSNLVRNEGYQLIMAEHKKEIDNVPSVNTIYLDLDTPDVNGLQITGTKEAVYKED